MTSAADISPGLASALAAASLASQQAQRAADAFDAKAGLSAIPSQHWELLRVAELLTKGLNVAHVQHQQQPQPMMSGMGGLTRPHPPPLFLPSLAANPGLVAEPPAVKAPTPVGQVAGSFPLPGALPASVSQAVMAGVTPAGLQMALASATQAALAAKAAAAGASPLHTEPQTPELAPGELRSPSFPVTRMRKETPTPCLPVNEGAFDAVTTVVRPIAVRPAPSPCARPAGVVTMCQASSPKSTGPSTVISSALLPAATGSPGAAFSPVMRGQQRGTPSPAASCELPPTAVAAADAMMPGRDASPKPSPKPSPRLSTGSAKPGSPTMRGVPAPPPLALSPRGAGVRKRRGVAGSPGRGASRTSMDTTVSAAAGLEGCADSMECVEAGGLEGEPTKGYKGRFCGRLFLKEDEKRLAAECELLGPLIGFPGPGKRGHCTVAKLARAIVAGSVRRACESRSAEVQELRARLAEQEAAADARAARLEAENAALRRELAAVRK